LSFIDVDFVNGPILKIENVKTSNIEASDINESINKIYNAYNNNNNISNLFVNAAKQSNMFKSSTVKPSDQRSAKQSAKNPWFDLGCREQRHNYI